MYHFGNLGLSDTVMMYVGFLVIVWCSTVVIFAMYRTESTNRMSISRVRVAFAHVVLEFSFREPPHGGESPRQDSKHRT